MFPCVILEKTNFKKSPVTVDKKTIFCTQIFIEPYKLIVTNHMVGRKTIVDSKFVRKLPNKIFINSFIFI